MNENEINKEILFLKNITHIYNQDHQRIKVLDNINVRVVKKHIMLILYYLKEINLRNYKPNLFLLKDGISVLKSKKIPIYQRNVTSKKNLHNGLLVPVVCQVWDL